MVQEIVTSINVVCLLEQLQCQQMQSVCLLIIDRQSMWWKFIKEFLRFSWAAICAEEEMDCIHYLYMIRPDCPPPKDLGHKLFWTLLPFSHFNAIIAAGAFIITLQKELFRALTVSRTVPERNPKLEGLGLGLLPIWLLNQHTKGRVISFRWLYFCTEGANWSDNITKWSCVKSFTVIKYIWKE